MDRRIGVLAGAPVVERDPVEQVVVRLGNRRRARLDLGGRRQVALRGQHDLAEPVEVEVLGDDQVLLEDDRHPLDGLEVVDGRHGQRRRGRCGQRVAAAEDA